MEWGDEMRYTRGRWESASDGYRIICRQEHREPFEIALAASIRWDRISVREEQKANANLIAAAPDLYEAARSLIGFFADDKNRHKDAYPLTELEMLAQAIQKAEGEIK
jgi:hypothetical protein